MTGTPVATPTQSPAQASGSFNPNNAVTDSLTSNDGVKEASGGPLTFDELDSVLSQDKLHNKRNSAKKETKKDITHDEKKVDAKAAMKAEKADEKPAKSEDKSQKTDQKSAKNDKSDSEDTEKPPRKTVKAKYEDSEIEIDEEALIPVTVNGKDEMWTIKELRQQQSGKIAYDKKFQELDKVRQGNSTDRMKLEASARAIKDAMTEKDPHLKIYKIAKIAGVDPVQFRQQWMKDQINYLENYQAMNEAERAADDSTYESKFQKHRADTLENQQKEQQATRALAQKLDQIRASHQIDEDTFWNRHDELEAQVQRGQLKASELTPEYIAHTIKIDRYWDPASEALDKLNLDWSDEQRGQELTNLVKKAMALDISPTKMAEMVDEKFGTAKARKKVEQKNQENTEFRSGKKEVVQHNQTPKDEPTFFGDM